MSGGGGERRRGGVDNGMGRNDGGYDNSWSDFIHES